MLVYHDKIFVFFSIQRIAITIKLSKFILDFGKLPLPSHLGKYITTNGKISIKIGEIGKIKTILGWE